MTPLKEPLKEPLRTAPMAPADAVRRIRREPGEALELVIPQRGLEINYGA